MKYKKVVITLLAISCIGFVGVGVFFLGQANQKETNVERTVTQVQQQESRKIAVVNLDEGIVETEQKINYADKIVQFPSSSFEYSSLEEARTGLENGKYGAYIIIPAGFSKNVVSLNTTPQSAQLEYALNKNLSGESQYYLLYDVMSFGNSLNDSLSYMYLNNILSEFHEAQDGAVTVMNNDLKDKDAIESIQSQDLIQLVEIPELKREENTTEPLNVEEYVEKNTTFVTNIDEQYKKCVEKAQIQLQNMQKEGGSLSEQLASLAEYTEKLDVFRDEEGNSVVDSANNKLDEVLNEKPSDTIEKLLENLKLQPGTISNELQNSMDQYNNDLEQQLRERLEEYKKKIQMEIPQLLLEDNGNGDYYLRYSDSNTPLLEIRLEDTTDSGVNQQVEDIKRLWGAITYKLLVAANEQETIEIIEQDSESGESIIKEYSVAKSVQTTLAECEQDTDLIAMTQRLGYSSVSGFLSDAGNGNLSFDKDSQIKIEGDTTAFKKHIDSVIGDMPLEGTPMQSYRDYLYDEMGNVIIDPDSGQPITVQKRFADYGEQVKKFEEELGNEHTVNGEEIKDIFRVFYVNPMQKNQENFNGILQQKYESELMYINEFNDKLNTFSPAMQDEYIAESVSGMKENNRLLQKNLTENNMSYMDFANKVYTTTEENIRSLQQGIQDAKDISDKAVEDGLSVAKNTKASTSRENQSILAGFSMKLPYTRIGSMEYTQAYQFIAKPANLNDISPEKEKTLTGKEIKEISSNMDSDKEEKHVVSYLIYIIFAVLLVTLITFLGLRYFRNRKIEQ